MNGGWFFTVAFSQLLCFPFLSPYTTSPPKEFLTTVFHCSRADPETHAFSQSSLLTFRESVNIFQNDSPTPAEIPKGPRKRIQGDEREQEILPPDPPRGFRHLLFLGPTGLLFPLPTVGPLRPQWVGNFMENL